MRRILFLTATFVLVNGISQAERPADMSSLPDRLRRGPGMRNHQVGMKPSRAVKIPDGWPVASDGSITCLTCHMQIPDLSGRSAPHLRETDRNNQAEFCSKCHMDGSDSVQSSPHWSVMNRAHQSTNQTSDFRSNSLMDSSSRQCLGCHDGVNASNASSGHANGASAGYGSNRGEHPVSMRYQKQRLGSRQVSLRHQSQLPKEILLPQGQVSCISCHDLFSSTKARLTIPIEKSALCFACHPMNE